MNEEIKEILKVDKQILDKIENILATELSSNEYDIFYNYFNEIRKPNILIDIKDVGSVKDYITNLQKGLNNQIEISNNRYVKLTNLQGENKCLKETNEEHRKINGTLRKENQKLVKVIDELVKHAYCTEMSLGEFKALFKIATGKDYIPKISLERQLTELKGGSDEKVESEE